MEKDRSLALGIILENSVYNRIYQMSDIYKYIEDKSIVDRDVDVEDSLVKMNVITEEGKSLVGFIISSGKLVKLTLTPELFKDIIRLSETSYIVENGEYHKVTEDLLNNL